MLRQNIENRPEVIVRDPRSIRPPVKGKKKEKDEKKNQSSKSSFLSSSDEDGRVKGVFSKDRPPVRPEQMFNEATETEKI